jgi:folate-binding protein YgfZ
MPAFMLENRSLLRVSGADAATFLQGLITQDITQASPERWLWAGLLSPQGKLLFDFLIRHVGDDFTLDVEAARSGDLMKKLNLYKLRADVSISAEPGAVVAGWNMPRPDDAAEDARHARLGWRGSGAAAADQTRAYQAHRWSLGIAEGAVELGIDKLLWLEANAGELGGVSLTKGCYVGQENTARMHHRSKVRKRIMIVQSAGTADVVMAGDKPAGDIMIQNGTQAVAVMRLDYIESILTLNNQPARLLRPDWLEPQLKSD